MEEPRTNSETNKVAGSPLQPSLLLFLAYLLSSFVLLSLLNIRVIWSVVTNSYVGSTGQVYTAPLTDNLIHFMAKLNTPMLMLVWGLFGAVVYSLIWFVQNTLSSVEKEIEESHYLKGGAVPVTSTGYWHRILMSNLSLIGMAVLWVFYMAIFLTILLPHASKLYYLAFYEPNTYKQILDIAGAMLISALSLYLFRIIYFILTSAWKTFRY